MWRKRWVRERDRVDAISQSCGGRAIIEDVSQVAITACAMHLGAHHSEGAILTLCNASILDRSRVTRPACTGFEFVARMKKRRCAGCAEIGAIAVLIPIDAAECALGVFFTKYRELRGREARLPSACIELQPAADKRRRLAQHRSWRGGAGPRGIHTSLRADFTASNDCATKRQRSCACAQQKDSSRRHWSLQRCDSLSAQRSLRTKESLAIANKMPRMAWSSLTISEKIILGFSNSVQ